MDGRPLEVNSAWTHPFSSRGIFWNSKENYPLYRFFWSVFSQCCSMYLVNNRCWLLEAGSIHPEPRGFVYICQLGRQHTWLGRIVVTFIGFRLSSKVCLSTENDSVARGLLKIFAITVTRLQTSKRARARGVWNSQLNRSSRFKRDKNEKNG